MSHVAPVVLSWSGGKDSALALRALRRSRRYTVVGLLTTVTAEYDRISMHGVRRQLLLEQARALGLPLSIVEISAGAGNEEYAARMSRALADIRARGVGRIAFGDLFLEDVRRYRENMLSEAGMEAVFPIWGEDTGELAREFLEVGFRAVVTCVDTQAVDPELAGRLFDGEFLRGLPASADPCGENGEFHTFVSEGPGFRSPVRYAIGGRSLRDARFMYCDLLPPRTGHPDPGGAE